MKIEPKLRPRLSGMFELSQKSEGFGLDFLGSE
jgi:hypothetical protein